jgi:DNA-binding response OmpR family regulator
LSHIVLLGLPEDIGEQISSLLIEDSHQVSRDLRLCEIESDLRAAAAFVWGDCPGCLETIRHLRECVPQVPVVVTTRLPDDRKWLDALDAGAADYCGGPFERAQIRWILDSVVKPADWAA